METLSEEVKEGISNNGLSLEDLPHLTAEDVKELAPRMKDRLELRALIEKIKNDAMTDQPTGPVTISTTPSKSTPSSTPAPSPGPSLSPATTSIPVSMSILPFTSENTDWHLSFKVPELTAFQYSTAKALQTGTFTQSSRQHVITQLKVLMLQHTQRPESKHYTAVCQALVQKYPACADSLRNKIGSWKTALTMAFKNFRRDHSPTCRKRGAESSSSSAAKRSHGSEICNEVLPREELEDLLRELKTEWLKTKGANKKRIRDIMGITFPNRRDWILESTPAILEVLQVYPALKKQRELRTEFRRVTGLEFVGATEAWVSKQTQVFDAGRTESSRAAVKKLLQKVDMEMDDIPYENDLKDFAMIELLEKLLYPRGPRGGGILLQHFEIADVDFDQEVLEQPEPFILVIGVPGNSETTYTTFAEGERYVEACNFREAIFDLFCLYYVFNIQYNKSISHILQIIQCFFFELSVSDIDKPKASIAKFLKLVHAQEN